MERTKKVVVETPTEVKVEIVQPEVVKPEVVISPKLRWKKVGGGHLYWQNQIIKPGQIFLAYESELPKSFMDTLVCIDSEDLRKEKERINKEGSPADVLYRLVEIKGGLWNVVNDKKKAINEKPLEKDLAEELKAALEA